MEFFKILHFNAIIYQITQFGLNLGKKNLLKFNEFKPNVLSQRAKFNKARKMWFMAFSKDKNKLSQNHKRLLCV